ncbi:MAG: 30S ribosomal protein S4 [Myxococcales bacterium]|nr:30S ribosomal protein S4 [Myxococcales bacterium]
MARYTGPRVKKMRSLGVNLPGLSRKSIDARPYPPGQHGKVGRRKLTEYGRRLLEKQKLRVNYGLSERQLRKLMSEAKHSKLDTGLKLLELLERRLDNVVFRAGFAPTIPAARQMINHGHIMVNGHRVDIPAYRVKAGDVVRPREKSAKKAHIVEAVKSPVLIRPNWMEFDEAEMAATVITLPDAESVPFPVEIQYVIEFYAKSL